MAMPRPIPRRAPVTMAVLPLTMSAMGNYPPDLVSEFDNHSKFCPLLVLSQDIALLGRGKSALRRKAKLIERNKFGGLFDTSPDLVFRFQSPALGCNKAEHHDPVLRQHP